MTPLAVGAVAAAAVWLVPQTARAAASAHLVYSRGPGAEQCPSEQALRAAVSSRLGYDPFFAWAHDTVFAEIARENGAFRAVVKLVDENNLQRGARAIAVQGGDCSAVIDAMGLTISLTIDPASFVGGPPLAVPSHEAPPPSAPPAAARAASSAAPAEVIPMRAPKRASDGSLHAGLGTAVSTNAAPSPTIGATLFVGVTWRSLSIDLEGRGDYPAADRS